MSSLPVAYGMLGKQDPVFDDRTLQLGHYLDLAALPPIQPALRWYLNIPKWPMFGNDRAGDCVFASAGHARVNMATNAHKQISLTTDDVIRAYSAVTGYNPNNGRNDNGANMLNVAKWWRKNPIGDMKIDAFAAVEPSSEDQLRIAACLFGGVWTGVALPVSGQAQMNAGKPWTVVGGSSGKPGGWGGHAMLIAGYDAQWVYFITWGHVQKASWAWLHAYVDEVYVIITQDWMSSANISPSGFAYADLMDDMKKF